MAPVQGEGKGLGATEEPSAGRQKDRKEAPASQACRPHLPTRGHTSCLAPCRI